MLLKSLEIQGFKSFPDKTKVNFGKGLTAIVGPNGSGKSNISDAVRWVMGEQSTKTLRGSKMEDVIFAGTKARKSQGFAEVSLTIDNTARRLAIDSDEVTITRRYDRSGESEYMINRSLVRLKDLQEVFMDTGLGKDGYSLIGQGKIAEIVQTKSTERREIFEEAAGITKFRYKRVESQRNLEKSEENLVRLRDIVLELQNRIEPLKEQAEKAKKFLSLAEEKKSLEVSLWVATIERTNQVLKDQSDKIVACESSREEIERQIGKTEQQIQDAFSKMQECLVKSEDLRHKKSEIEKEIADFSAQIAVCRNNIEHNRQSIERVKNEISGHNETVVSAEREIAEKQGIISELDEKLTTVKRETLQKQNRLLEHSGQSAELSNKEKVLSDEVNRLLLNQSEIKMTVASAQTTLEELEQTISANADEEIKNRETIEKYEQDLKEQQDFLVLLDEKLQGLNNTYAGHQIKLKNRSEKRQIMKAECDKAGLAVKEKEQKMRILQSMEQEMDGYAESVKGVLKLASRGVLKGVKGTVSQLVEVDDEYAVAIETALGGAMQNIVVENENDAKAAIRILKQENMGRATFLPTTSVNGSMLNESGLAAYAGYIAPAAKLVKCDEKYSSIIMSLLGRTAIVDDIDSAVLIAQKNGYKFRIVTLDGQVVNAGGSLTGGSRNKGQSFLSRKNEISMLESEILALRQKLSEKTAAMEEISTEVSKMQAEFTAVTSEITTVNEDKIRVDGEIKRLEQFRLQATQNLASMKSELNAKRAKSDTLKQSIEVNLNALRELAGEIENKNSELEKIQSTNADASTQKTKLAEEISELNISTIAIEKDIEANKSVIEEINRRTRQTGELAKELSSSIERLNNDNVGIEEQISALTEKTEQNKRTIEEITAEIERQIIMRQELEGKTTSLNKDIRSVSEQKEKISSEIARLSEKKNQIEREYDDVIAKLFSEYELTKSEAQAIAQPIEDFNKASNYLNSLKNKIRGLGSVNVDAIEEYKEVSERYEFLTKQVHDAEKARAELLKLIDELTDKMQEIFEDNFIKINANFKQIFIELFGGGNADLRLTNPNDLLESGIEIFVEPPGKVISNLAMLSGGEQAFVAIAIYFAILKVRPAPFCILDEIEAALDDVNVDKYASYLRSMSDNTQFIMITHRRGSMEAADVLYGVTMQDEGVSKLLELNVSDIASKLKMNV